jgi:signal transduction histidine kinase
LDRKKHFDHGWLRIFRSVDLGAKFMNVDARSINIGERAGEGEAPGRAAGAGQRPGQILPFANRTADSAQIYKDEPLLSELSIVELHKKALSLEKEVFERKQVEETLRGTLAELQETLEQRTSALRQLSARLLSLQDIERRRLARELHDDLGQYLVGLKLNVDMLRESPTREKLWDETEDLMQQCIGEVRTLAYLLHPPTMDEAGFVSAARWYVEGFGQRSGVQVTLNAPEELERLPDPIELGLFRVLQEALTNVHRHSGASRAYVAITQDEAHVRMEVRDNGRGMSHDLLRQFEATGGGMGVGIAGVRERARELCGKLTIESNRNGTLLAIEIPHFAAKEKGS